MNEIFSKIKYKIKSIISFKKINPHNHWRILLYIFFLMIIVLIIFSFYLLYEVKNQQFSQVTIKPTENSVLINEKLLKKINDSFTTKQVNEKEIKEGIKTYQDPSI